MAAFPVICKNILYALHWDHVRNFLSRLRSLYDLWWSIDIIALLRDWKLMTSRGQSSFRLNCALNRVTAVSSLWHDFFQVSKHGSCSLSVIQVLPWCFIVCIVSMFDYNYFVANVLLYMSKTRVLRTHTRCAVIVCAVSYYIASSYVIMGTWAVAKHTYNEPGRDVTWTAINALVISSDFCIVSEMRHGLQLMH